MTQGTQCPHLQRIGGHTRLIVDGQPFVMLAGEVHNSSGSSLPYLRTSLDKLVAMNCNSAIVPIYWELTEPEEGQFDFALIDGVIEAARERGLRLALLWFGTWKNAISSYAPRWVKMDRVRFPLAQTSPGKTTGAITCLSGEACEADSKAFAAVMRHIWEFDGIAHTVITVQVQNETGLLGSSRDRSPIAEEEFQRQVPMELISYLESNKENLIPWLYETWGNQGFCNSGPWASVFGDGADEIFMAWSIGRYVDAVAAAGRSQYDLPMFVNAWLVQYPSEPAGRYPSGGPVAKVMDVWRAAAPNIDLFAPDIYLNSFKAVCAEYTQSGNPLLIPEARMDKASANVFYAVCQHDALCFAPFGIDGNHDQGPLRESYGLLRNMMPLLLKYRESGLMMGFVQEDALEEDLHLAGHGIKVRYNQPPEDGCLPGTGLIISVSSQEYIVAGAGFALEFDDELLSVDEGWFTERCEWVSGRRMNGDEWGVRLGSQLECRRVELLPAAELR